MSKAIPSTADLRHALEQLTRAQVVQLSDVSKVPFHTLLKVRSGETQNPGIETVRQFWPFVRKFN